MAHAWNKWRWDGLGLSIAGLCLIHCIVTTILLAVLASASGFFLNPVIHEVGLLLAIILGMLAATVGALGIGMMGGALTLPHGGVEIAFTVVGVTLLGLGHLLNHRAKT